MYKTVDVFDTKFTNSQKYWKTNQKNTHSGIFNFWQGHLCNSRFDFIRDLSSFGKNVKIFLQLAIADKSCYNAKKDNI